MIVVNKCSYITLTYEFLFIVNMRTDLIIIIDRMQKQHCTIFYKFYFVIFFMTICFDHI